MINADNIHLRRQLLDWRDKHIENTYHHLNHELNMLFREIDIKLEEIPFLEIFSSKSYFKKHLEPIYLQWLENETTTLINSAQNELNQIYRHEIEHKNSHGELKYRDGNDSVVDAATASLSTGIAIAAILAVLSLSTTTVSAGGLLGILGLSTATAISWPIALVGGTTLLVLSGFGISKAGNLKSDAIRRLRKKLHESIRDRVIYSKANDSVCQLLQIKIADVTKNLLRALEI